MRVFKFGGASVKDAAAIQNLESILRSHPDPSGWIVISAMAKTTNALERVVKALEESVEAALEEFREVREFHIEEARLLSRESGTDLSVVLEPLLIGFEKGLYSWRSLPYGERYDAMVGYGEWLSTTLISAYLNDRGIPIQWVDARKLIITDAHHRRASVHWDQTEENLRAVQDDIRRWKIIGGFVGATKSGVPTTLGREGSDFTAAIIAYCLDASEVTIWKDVEGVLNGDPKVFGNTLLLEEIAYREAIELAYYGASVIHPKTVQPLQKKEIPLRVRSFMNPSSKGTVIKKGLMLKPMVPCFIQKRDQVLISLSTRNLDFIIEDHLSRIYRTFHQHGVAVNLMQNSAVTTSFSVNQDPVLLPRLMDDLAVDFDLRYNEGLTLFTIRHHNSEIIERYRGYCEVYLEQITRHTYQLLGKPKDGSNNFYF
ncbi:MAG: aspartate kinase [Bacteroidota bacterium]|nr:aspartate kinase [Bacteroidota bacterium]